MSEKAIYFDSSKCTACRGCQVACKVWNELPSPIEFNAGEFTGTYQNPPDLNPDTRLIITFDERDRENAHGVDWAFGRRSCMHCTNAECVRVCPSGALRYDETGTGFVIYDRDTCIGCQYCRTACPFDVPRHTGINVAGNSTVINKCTACFDRIRHGRKPACVSTCQPGALQFGDRDKMIEKAKKRVEVLKGKGFDQARVYGETEMGGLHVISVLQYDIAQYQGYVDNPAASGTTDALGVMKPVAAVAAVGIVAGLGISRLASTGYKRDRQYYDEQHNDVIDVDKDVVMKHIDKEKGER